MGFWTRPSVEGTGAYRNSAGQIETNPVTVGRPLVDTVDDPQTGRRRTHPDTRQALTTGEAVRGLLDAQEGSAWNRVITTTSGPDMTSLAVRIGRPPSREEMLRLEAVASKHGFGLANTEDGVAFLNFDEGANSTSVGRLLRTGMQRDIEQALPGARVERGRLDSGYVDFSGAYAAENAGQGAATRIMVTELEKLRAVAPRMYENLLDSAGISRKASQNLTRLIEAGGGGDRPDYQRLLSIVGEGGLRELMRRIERLGYAGLPGGAGAVALGREYAGASSSRREEE
jgi:hypothetical protein